MLYKLRTSSGVFTECKHRGNKVNLNIKNGVNINVVSQ